MSELTSMRNIGGEMAKKLTAVGIDSPEKLTQLGARQAFSMLKAAYPRVCLVHLYALEGAILGVDFNCLSAEQKADCRAFSDLLRRR